MLPTIFFGLTSMKLEKRIQKMYTFTYLRLFTFMLPSIQYKIVATMRKANLAVNPPPSLEDISNILQNFKFLHLRVDEIVGGPVSTLPGIKCGLQTLWYKKG